MKNMTFKSLALAFLLLVSLPGWAQRDLELVDWVEEAVPPPPAFDTARLLTFDVSQA